MHIYIYACMCVCTYTYACIYLSMYTYMYVHTYMHIYMYTYIYIYTSIFIYTYLYIYVYIYIYILVSLSVAPCQKRKSQMLAYSWIKLAVDALDMFKTSNKHAPASRWSHVGPTFAVIELLKTHDIVESLFNDKTCA